MAVVSMRILSIPGVPSALIGIFIWLLLTEPFGSIAQTDVECLRAIRKSLEDPLGYLSSWDFSNSSGTSVCNFIGIECWHRNDNSVLNIKLPGMGLRGNFPQAISLCKELTGLDLSGNSIRGSIPDNISMLVPFVVSLDLSSNQLSGQIPVDLSNCSFLNVLKLNNNQLTGHIPPQLGELYRLREFSVANNRLTGKVPRFRDANITREDYANNAGLCGAPLPACKSI